MSRGAPTLPTVDEVFKDCDIRYLMVIVKLFLVDNERDCELERF